MCWRKRWIAFVRKPVFATVPTIAAWCLPLEREKLAAVSRARIAPRILAEKGEANGVLRLPIRERMPLIVPPEKYRLWLDSAEHDEPVLSGILRPYDASEMEAYPVSTFVNNPKQDGPECIERLGAAS